MRMNMKLKMTNSIKLKDALYLPTHGKCISIVGAGGKTSLLFKLAHELTEDGLKCVVLTSTHIYQPTLKQAITITDDLPHAKKALALALSKNIPVAIGSLEASTHKLCMPSKELLSAAWDQADWILVEADGSRNLPMKFPASHEPVILDASHRVIALAGLRAIGKPLSQVCQRANLAAEFLQVSLDTMVTPWILARILTSEQGQLKGIKDPSIFSIFLNQADDENLYNLAIETTYHIKSFLPNCPVVAGSLQKGEIFIC